MLIFDGHSDFLTDITIQHLKGEKNVFSTRHIPKLRKGSVGALIGVIWADPPYDAHSPQRLLETLRSSFADLRESEQAVFPVKSHKELMDAIKADKIAVVLGMEGLSSLEADPEGLYFLYELGVRHASLTWNEGNAFATGVRAPQEKKGLTEKGHQVVRIMEELGMLLDVSHADERTFWDILGTASCPIIASHSNAYSLCQNNRNLKDDQLLAIGKSGGVVGINAWPEFVDEKHPTLDKLIHHVDYIVEKVGIDHVSFGFDFTDFLEEGSLNSFQDGDLSKTVDIGCAEEIPNLINGLLKKGYTSEDVKKIAFQNMERVFAQVVK